MAKKTSMIDGDIPSVLREFAIPMGFGLICMIMVNVIDTYWVAQLGTLELAAMSLSFPIIGFVTNISFGLMIGVTTAISRAIGEGEQDKVKKVTTHALYLGLLVVSLVTLIGLMSQATVFRWLGATDDVLPLVLDYMSIWFYGTILLIVPLIGNGALRASGDAKTPMFMMIAAAVVNAVLDPLFIFGGFGIEPMGIKGAAYATVASRFVGMCIIFGVLLFRDKLIEMARPTVEEIKNSWRSILSVGLPAILSNVMGPIAVAALTSMVAVYGSEALAAYGIGARIDAMLLIIPGALTAALSPFVGQNFGAHLPDRVAKGIQVSLNFVIIYGLVTLGILFFGAEHIAGLFSSDEKVVEALTIYLTIIPIGYAAASSIRVASSAFNAVDHAFKSTMLSLLQSLFIAIPTAWIGSQFLGLKGVFLGLVVAAFITSLLGIRWLGELLNPEEEITPDKDIPLCKDSSCKLLNNLVLEQQLSQLLDGVLELEDVQLKKVRSDAVGIFAGQRELAHIEKQGRIDIPLPLEVGQNLIRLNVVKHHPSHDNGWYIHQMDTEKEVQQGVWLLFLAHSLYMIRKRGGGCEVTQEELGKLCVSEQCRQSILASMSRWGVSEQQAS